MESLCLSAPGHAGRSLEISNLVDIRSESNRELAMRLVSDVANGNRFYSDLNGFQVCWLRLILTDQKPLKGLLADC